MSASDIPPDLRTQRFFHHIDMGFLNRRLCMSALGPLRPLYLERAKQGSDHLTQLGNDHLLVTMLLDVCQELKAPTLLEALTLGKPRHLFRSTERLSPCPEIYDKVPRVEHLVELDVDVGKPVRVAYHTEHLVSSTGTMTLAEGSKKGYVESIVGLLHDRVPTHFEVEPLVMGAPWFEHPRNGEASESLMWFGRDFGEILPEDIDQFAKMKSVVVEDKREWMEYMKKTPEKKIKLAFAQLLNEPAKDDWGGESNDHFSSNLSIRGQRGTAAFLFKGPTNFREMTLEMCEKEPIRF